MFRAIAATALLTTVCFPTSSPAQGPLERIGQGLDNAGRNIRRGVENAVARGQMEAQEQDLLGRVLFRIRWDKLLLNSAMQVEARPDGVVVLRGSVSDRAAKTRAVDIAQNTVGVTSVVDELAVVKTVKVIQASPAVSPPVLESVPSRVITVPPAPVETKVVVPPDAQVIVKP